MKEIKISVKLKTVKLFLNGDTFDEIASLSKNCNYVDCTHTHEPGCAVLKAIRDKKLDENKYLNYVKLKKEAKYYEMTDFERRRKGRQFGRFVKKALAQLKKYDFDN